MLNIWCTIDIYFHGENLYTAILSLSPIGSFFERLLVDDISRFEFESAIVLRIDEKKKKKKKLPWPDCLRFKDRTKHVRTSPGAFSATSSSNQPSTTNVLGNRLAYRLAYSAKIFSIQTALSPAPFYYYLSTIYRYSDEKRNPGVRTRPRNKCTRQKSHPKLIGSAETSEEQRIYSDEN